MRNGYTSSSFSAMYFPLNIRIEKFINGQDMNAGEHSSDCGGFIHALSFIVCRWKQQVHHLHSPARGLLDAEGKLRGGATTAAKNRVNIDMMNAYDVG